MGWDWVQAQVEAGLVQPGIAAEVEATIDWVIDGW